MEREQARKRSMDLMKLWGGMVIAVATTTAGAGAQSLPDAPQPQAWLMASNDAPPLDQASAQQGKAAAGKPVERCRTFSWRMRQAQGAKVSCEEDPIQMIVGSGPVAPLTSTQKAELAGRNIIDPFNLITITGYSAIYVAANAHSPYGPGFKGFGRLTGYSLAEDTQGEFFGVYAIPSLVHEDPRYHRMPGHPVGVRLLHAVSHTVLARHDDGTLMPNYATLGTYPISAALSDAYVPGIDTGGGAYAKRVLLGYATDPVGALIAEFLPDVAKRIHVRVVFVQQILNQIATKSNTQ